MKCIATKVFVLATIILAQAQKSPIKFGEIPMEDLKMTMYEPDSSASAVILVDYGHAFVSITSISANLNFQKHVRIKILKKDGTKWADAAIPLFHSGSAEETVTNLKAVTYNLVDGKIVESKMSKDGIFKEKFNRNFNLQKFTLPNVKEGSIIEYSYTIMSDFLANFQNWQFQYSIPVKHSEYWATIPDFFIMEKYMQGYISPTTYEVKDKTQSGYSEKAHHWIIKEVPAFREEPYMTSEDDYVSKINFALAYINFPQQPTREIMGSWKKLNDELLESESFGKIISGSNYLKKTTEEVLAGEIDEIKKLEKIFNYVQSVVEWDGVKDFYAEKPKELLEKKKGSVGGINLILGSMLEKAGFTVDMVLISTRDHGFVREQYPMSKQFNYVVCAPRVNGKIIFLDATEKFLPVGILPERCLNGQGLIISKNFHGWIPLETKTKDRKVTSAELTLSQSGELNGKITFNQDGYAGINARKEFKNKGESTYIKNTIGGKTNWQIAKSTFENMEDVSKSAKEIHEITISDHAVTSGDITYINPFVSDQLEQNPFKLEDRTYPVDYGSLKDKIYMCKITLPEGYAVEELPQSKVMVLPGGAGKYTYSCGQAGNVINVVSNFQISRNIFVQNEYASLREFYNQVVAKQAEQIVLKKK